VDEYRRLVNESGPTGIEVTVSGSSARTSTDTQDPTGRAMIDQLGKGESLQDFAVSVLVEGYK
jgi:hypothetical protein